MNDGSKQIRIKLLIHKMMFLEGSVIYSAWIEYINFKNTVIIVLYVESFINNTRANIIKRD